MARITGCIFCDGKPLTHEDFYPRWARESGLLKGEHPKTIRWNSTHGAGAVQTLVVGGDPITRTLKVVCDKCNNGWMSELQNRAKPILTAMCLGHWPTLDKVGARTIGAWATMFTMVIEFDHIENVAATKVERRKFRATRNPPPFWSVSVGRYERSTNNVKWHRGLVCTLSGVPTGKNMQTTTFSFAGLLFHVLSCPPQIASIERLAYSNDRQLSLIWPFAKEGCREPEVVLKDPQVVSICRRVWAEHDLPDDLPEHGFRANDYDD